MSYLVAIIVGGIVGWLASRLMRRGNRNVISDIIIGIVGAVLGRWFFGSVLGIGSALAAGTFSLLGIVWGIIGAVILIALIRAIAPESEKKGKMGPTYSEEVRRHKNHHDDDENRRIE